MNYVHVIFGRNKSRHSVVIQGWQYWQNRYQYKWSHVGVYLPDQQLVLEAKGGEHCQSTTIVDFMARYDEVTIRKLPVLDVDIALAYYWHHVNRKTGYDKRSIWGHVRGDFDHDINTLNCAEFVAGGTGYNLIPQALNPQQIYLNTYV